MRRLSVVILLSVIPVFFSCDTKYYTVMVGNQSSKAVTYTYNGTTNTLPATGDFVEYRVEAYTLPPYDISVPGAMSVKMESFSGDYVFKNLPALDLEVENKLEMDVNLTASKYISNTLSYDYIEDNSGATILSILAGPPGPGIAQHSPAKIYTANPAFALQLYSAEITWTIKDNVMKVLIE